MESTVHPFSELFAQLGLANDNQGIQRFIAAHSPLPDGLRLEDAPLWSMVVDRLNVALHAMPA